MLLLRMFKLLKYLKGNQNLLHKKRKRGGKTTSKNKGGVLKFAPKDG